jgi:hypothetical protein
MVRGRLGEFDHAVFDIFGGGELRGRYTLFGQLLLLEFDASFRASVGDVLTFLQFDGTELEIDARSVPPELIPRALRYQLFEDNGQLPAGYDYVAHVDAHSIGIRITAVPEAGSVALVGIGCAFVIILRSAVGSRWRSRLNGSS